MSVLTDKNIFVIGEETEQLTKLEAALITYGATVTAATCQAITVETMVTQQADLIILNHLHDGSHCRSFLDTLQQAQLDASLPVLVLVKNDQAHINEVFMLGATDYFTAEEDVHDTLEKVKAAFGASTTDAGSVAIDITPAVAKDQAGTRVFVVEDDPLLRNLLAAKFEKSKLPFKIIATGDALLEEVAAFAPHIVILDLMLPGKDGFELLAELKSSPQADIPVIIFSNKDSADDRAKAKDGGAVAFHVKALTDLTELLQVIETHASPT